MSKNDDAHPDAMDQRFHGEMLHLGWRLPLTEGDVRDAEPVVDAFPGEVPEQLMGAIELVVPDVPSSQRASGMIERYMRDGGADARRRDRETRADKRTGPERG